MVRRWLFAAALLAVAPMAYAQAPAPAKAVDITGKWTTSFDTQIGEQHYTYDFVAKGAALTGKITSDNGSSDLKDGKKDGKIDGATVTFTENLDFQGMSIAISYTGTITSADEIKFIRHVAEFATEELVARRAK
jgi:hypothetical protein